MEKLNQYQREALKTADTKLDPYDQMVNAVMGLNGESGEVADHLKKAMFQGHQLDREKLRDECGDVLWYVSLLAHALGLTLQEVAERNIEKLRARYPGGFTVEASRNREQ